MSSDRSEADSSPPWHSDLALSRKAVADALEADLPMLGATRIEELGEGWSSFAFLVDGEWVFRFPKRATVAESLACEAQVLPRLAAALPVGVPVIEHFVAAPATLPFAYGGYRALRGTFAWDCRLTRDAVRAVAGSYAGILTALHAFDASVATACGCRRRSVADLLPAPDATLALFDRIPESRAGARWHAFAAYRSRLTRYLDAVASDAMGAAGDEVLTHGDLLPDHLLLNEARDAITGIIDWGEVGITDPAADFSGLYYWRGADFCAGVLRDCDRRYDSGVLARARHLALYVGIGDVWYGLSQELPNYLRIGLDCLDHCLDDH